MGTQTYKFQNRIVRLSINKKQVWLNVTFSMVLHQPLQRVVSFCRWKQLVVGQARHDFRQNLLQAGPVLPSDFTLEILFELRCSFNRSHSGQP